MSFRISVYFYHFNWNYTKFEILPLLQIIIFFGFSRHLVLLCTQIYIMFKYIVKVYEYMQAFQDHTQIGKRK
jgi:hypothetical protein